MRSCQYRRFRTHRRVAAMAFAVVAAISVSAGLAPPASADPVSLTSSNSRTGYITAAEYFGTGDPFNLWSSALTSAAASFKQMRTEGFNTIGMIVPWGEFEPGINPVRFDPQSFASLTKLVQTATRLHMGVILRLGYEWDVAPGEQMPGSARFDALWSINGVYNAWLKFIGRVHSAVARFGNVRDAYISWEDLWQPVFEAQAASTPQQRLSLAASTGYRTWLEAHKTLAVVNSAYGATFSSWSQVPVPSFQSPSFQLMYQYEDWALVHRLFIPAQRRYPGLTMESRVDVDPIYNNSTVVGHYSHTTQYTLPGTSTTGMYFSPYMGDPSSTLNETAGEALSSLTATLSRMHSVSGGRSLFIYEYEFESNSPQVASDPALTPQALPTFILGSATALQRYTSGYALWTYRDYRTSHVFNPTFAFGVRGWKISRLGGIHLHSQRGPYLTLKSGGAASQKVAATTLTTSVTLSVRASAAAATTMTVTVGGHTSALSISRGWHTYRLSITSPTSGDLSLKAAGTISLTRVQLYSHTQQGDVYSVRGTPEIGAGPIRTLNKQLTATSPSSSTH